MAAGGEAMEGGSGHVISFQPGVCMFDVHCALLGLLRCSHMFYAFLTPFKIRRERKETQAAQGHVGI